MKDESPAEIAARWVACNSLGALTAAQARAMHAWLAADVRNRVAYEAATAAMQDLGGAQFALRRVDWEARAAAARTQRVSMRRIAGLAASVAALSIMFFRSDFATLTADYGTGPGVSKSVVLPDGTRVVLDTRSAIDVEYSAAARDVVLLHGRALFEVTHDATRPFTVHAVGAEVHDIGTTFIVREMGDRAEVQVTAGEVHVVSNDARVELTRGFAARWQEGHEPAPAAPFDTSTALAWSTGIVVVDRLPLAEVIVEMNRYRRRPIVLLDRRAAPSPVSGVVQTANLDESIDSLAAAQGLQALALPFATVLYSAGDEPSAPHE